MPEQISVNRGELPPGVDSSNNQIVKQPLGLFTARQERALISCAATGRFAFNKKKKAGQVPPLNR
jgi:hypothetical protein